REGFVTDNGNVILDVRGLDLTDPVALEGEINQIAGVVTNGLFARRGADLLLLGTARGVETRARETLAASRSRRRARIRILAANGRRRVTDLPAPGARIPVRAKTSRAGRMPAAVSAYA